MSLAAAINKSISGINVAQLGLQVVSNNIANANTPGYIRQELVQVPGEAVKVGGLIHGTGVRPVGIVQQIDKALAERLRTATSELNANEELGKAQSQLESLINELGDQDLSSQLSAFNGSLHDLANQPNDFALKQLVVLQGQTLAEHVQRLNGRATEFLTTANAALQGTVFDVNSLTTKVAALNKRIVDIEGGRTLGSDATGLRDERQVALGKLAEYMDINTQEQSTGAVAVFVGGDFLVLDSVSRDIYAAQDSIDPRAPYELRIVETDAPLTIKSGRLAGAAAARDQIYGEFLNDLDTIAATVAETFNRTHSQGKGTLGFTTLTGTVGADPDVPLDQAGLDFAPENGSFRIQLFGEDDSLIAGHQIDVDLFSNGSGTRLSDVADQISAIDGLAASVTQDGQLSIATTASGTQFGFADDTSGFLAAAGLNTFFTGNDARSLGVNQLVVDSPEHLAISESGLGTDAENLKQLVDLLERPLDRLGGVSVRDRYQQLVTTITQDAAVQQSVTEGLRSYHAALESDHLAVTSVNIDEEAIKMVYLQRAFQASSRVISAASEMLEILVSL